MECSKEWRVPTQGWIVRANESWFQASGSPVCSIPRWGGREVQEKSSLVMLRQCHREILVFMEGDYVYVVTSHVLGHSEVHSS